ncbi:unnamed protein product [Closterium sp. Yama58-4]|nr:unnamed protein product [Closterium sp. Yama58-4]
MEPTVGFPSREQSNATCRQCKESTTFATNLNKPPTWTSDMVLGWAGHHDGEVEFLEKMRRRLDSVGVSFPGVEVRFEGVSACAKVQVGARGLPTLLNQLADSVGALLGGVRLLNDQCRLFFALHGCSGILKPGRMTLLLGPPGSGKSTLLNILAGKAERELRVQGEVTYNGRHRSEFVLPRSVAFVPQTDSHIGEMTVRETLEFSARLQGPGHLTDLFRQLEEKEREMGVKSDAVVQAVIKAMGDERRWSGVVVPYVLKMLSLDVCADTMVGDSMRRGISGGEKKRLTISEALLGAKQVLLLDEISTGLDSSTAYRIIQCLCSLTHLTNTTTLISLLQPAPETFELFDDVMLMSEGRIVYHGPREEVLGFFQEMGFAPPARKGVADFLQEVTSLKDQEQYWHPSQPHTYRYVSVRAFKEAFRESWFGKQMEAELSIPFKKDRVTVKGEDGGKEAEYMEEGQGKDAENGGEGGNGCSEEGCVSRAVAQRRFVLPPLAMLRVVVGREWLLMRRNLLLYIVQTVQILPLAIVTMTVFWRSQFTITPVDGNYYLGAIFFGIITMLFGGFIEITLLTARLPIFFLQRDSLLLPAWAWCVPMALLSLPVSLWSAAVWTAVTYYGIGFAPEFSRFITQLLLFFLTHAATSALYRAMGVILRSTVLVNTLGNFILALLFLLSGFIITKPDIHGVWVWVYWLSPLTYVLNAFSTNEFLAPRWDVPSMPPSLNVTMGVQVLEARSLWTQGYWVWAGAAISVFFTLFCNAVTILALKYLNSWPKAQPVISQHQLDAREAALTGTNLLRNDRLEREHSRNKLALSGVGEVKQHGMVLPFTPLTLSFHNVNYSVPLSCPRRLTGIGSSCLILIPARLHLQKLVEAVNGALVTGAVVTTSHRLLCSLYPLLLASPSSLPLLSGKICVEEEFVAEVEELVELEAVKGAVVGRAGQDGLSVEQRKRLTIAVELVANPSIIFMDKPTSGRAGCEGSGHSDEGGAQHSEDGPHSGVHHPPAFHPHLGIV